MQCDMQGHIPRRVALAPAEGHGAVCGCCSVASDCVLQERGMTPCCGRRVCSGSSRGDGWDWYAGTWSRALLWCVALW